MTRRVLAAVIAAVLALAVPQAAAAATPAVVHGHVQSTTGAPLGGIEVQIIRVTVEAKTTSYVQAFLTTDAAGNFLLERDPGDYYLAFSDPSGALAPTAYPGGLRSRAPAGHHTTVPLPVGGTLDVTIALEPAASVSGTVLSASGKPVPTTLVELFDGTGVNPSAYTDSAGNYTIGGIAPGTYSVRFRAEEFAPEWNGNARARTGSTPITVVAGQVVAGLNAILEEGGDITGRITIDGKPLLRHTRETVVVSVSDITGEHIRSARATPAFKLWNLPAGKYRLYFSGYKADGKWVASEAYGGDEDRASGTVFTVRNGSKKSKLSIDLRSVPKHASHKLSSTVVVSAPRSVARGEAFTTKVRVDTYGDRTGKVVLIVGGKRVRRRSAPTGESRSAHRRGGSPAALGRSRSSTAAMPRRSAIAISGPSASASCLPVESGTHRRGDDRQFVHVPGRGDHHRRGTGARAAGRRRSLDRQGSRAPLRSRRGTALQRAGARGIGAAACR
jgi:hypothetical protein